MNYYREDYCITELLKVIKSLTVRVGRKGHIYSTQHVEIFEFRSVLSGVLPVEQKQILTLGDVGNWNT